LINTTIKYILHVLVPFLIGASIYILFRGFYFFDYSVKSFLGNVFTLPNWLLYNLPDGLWLYSFLATIKFIWIRKSKKAGMVWMVLSVTFCFVAEILQDYGIVHGTFDWHDIMFYVIAIICSTVFLPGRFCQNSILPNHRNHNQAYIN